MSTKIEKIEIEFGGKKVGAHKLTVSSEIPIDIENAWNKVITSSLLEFVGKGKVKFIPTDGKFPKIWKQGDIVTTRILVYGFIPFGGLHTIQFKKMDVENKVLQTIEKDAFSKVWNHKITMKPLGGNIIYYKDEIVIYGGLLTGFITWWAKYFFIHRQKRLHLLAELEV